MFNQAGSNNMPWNNGPVFLMNGDDGTPIYESYELVSLKVFGDVGSVTAQPTQVRSNSATMTGSLVNPVVVGADQLIEFNFDAGQIYTNLGTNGLGSLPMRLDPTLGGGQMGYTTRPIPVGNQMTFGGGTAGQEVYGELTILLQERQTVRVVSFVNKKTGEICNYLQDSMGAWSELAVIPDDWDLCPPASSEISISAECKQELAEAIAEENAKCAAAQYSQKQFTNPNSLVNLSNFAASAGDTIDNAVVTIADIEAFFDGFDYDAAPVAMSTQGDFSIADFIGGAGTESNTSFVEGYINVTGPMFIRMQNTNNWSGRVDLGVNCGSYQDILTHYNGPGQSATSPSAPIPLGIHRIRVSSWDYDGANGNINIQFSVTGANGWTTDAAGIAGLEFTNVAPIERCFLGRVCEGSEDVIEVSTGLVVDGAELSKPASTNEPVEIDFEALAEAVVNRQNLDVPIGIIENCDGDCYWEIYKGGIRVGPFMTPTKDNSELTTPTLAPSGGKLVSDFFSDGANLAPFSLQLRNTTNAPINWEATISNAPYATITNLSGPVTLVSSQNADGTYQHLLTGTAPIAAFASAPINGDVPSPAGDGTGLELFCESA